MKVEMDPNSKKVLTNFIAIYKSLPQLWDPTCLGYGNRKCREAGYIQFVKRLSQICPKVTIKEIKTKINAIRTNFRREIKKMKESSYYTTSLWYFNKLRFLEKTLQRITVNSKKFVEKRIDSIDGKRPMVMLMKPKDSNKFDVRSSCDDGSLSSGGSGNINLSIKNIPSTSTSRNNPSGERVDTRLESSETSITNVKTEIDDFYISKLTQNSAIQEDIFVGCENHTDHNNISIEDIVAIEPNLQSDFIRHEQRLKRQKKSNSAPTVLNVNARRFPDFIEDPQSNSSSDDTTATTSAPVKEASTQIECNGTSPLINAASTFTSRKRKRTYDRCMLETIHDHLNNREDEADLLGKVWAQKLKKLEKDQRSIVEKFIANIFMEAEFKTLNKNSIQVIN